MSKKLFIAVLIIVGFSLSGCHSTTPEVVQSQVRTEKMPVISPTPGETPLPQAAEIQLPSGGKVEFKGVSFSYNPKIFGEIKVREVDEYPLENETDRPDGVEPRHLSFRFGLAADSSVARIEIFPIEDFPRMYAVNKDSVKMIEKEIEAFKKNLKDKNYRLKGQIPYLRWLDAHQAFQAKVRHFKFQNGSGIFFLTHWSIESALLSNNRLRYTFEGLTDDGKNYVLAEISVSAAFLPKDEPDEFEGFKVQDIYKDDAASRKRYQQYISSITKRLENLPPDQYEPNLKSFEEIISSLKIEK
jgi:hypothetical protein